MSAAAIPPGRRFSGQDSSSHREPSESSGAVELRETLSKRRHTLTDSEFQYLHNLSMFGNEIECQLAHETVLDDDWFPNVQIGKERENSVRSSERSLRNSSPDNLLDDSTTASVCSTKSSRRQELLKSRKTIKVFGNIWKAHENSIPVSRTSSRRSLFLREGHSNPNIFRTAAGALMQDVRSDNNRRVSWSVRRPTHADSLKLARRPSLQRPSLQRPSFRRMESDVSRKSVTFDLPKASGSKSKPPLFTAASRASSMGSIGSYPSLHQGHPIVSSPSQRTSSIGSIGSIPSLHHAHSVHSAVSGGHVPSIHHAHSVHSAVSAGRTPSIHLAHSVHSHSSDLTQSEVDVPSKVVIPGPVHGETEAIQEATKLLQVSDPDAPFYLPERPSVVMRNVSGGVEVWDDDLWDLTSIQTSNSFDETRSYSRVAETIFRRVHHHSYTDDSYIEVRRKSLFDSYSSLREQFPMDDDSWKLGEEEDEDYYDSWKAIEDEYVNGYGGGNTLPFVILGTSGNDEASIPHVLSPPLMESLQAFLPTSLSNNNFWMKYSMVRDGASFYTFLQHARGAKYSILAIETTDQEVFGSFTGENWRKNWNYFGNGESFLWKMRKSRQEKAHSIIDQAHLESEIDVYPYTGNNDCLQLCTQDRIAIGGGSIDPDSKDESKYKDFEWGFGLTIERDFMTGTSSPCLTFASPALSSTHQFDILNIELWTLTPCNNVDDAEKLELSKLFLDKATRQ